MKKIVFLIVVAITLPFLSWAGGKHDGQKKKKKCKKEDCRPQIHSIEEFGFMVPPPSNKSCKDKKLYHQAVVNFYKWYLRNEHIISKGLSNLNKNKDLLPPFHVSFMTLHRFYQFIKRRYPKWVNKVGTDSLVCQTKFSGKPASFKVVSSERQVALDTLSAI